jgi:hypothetical protein
MNDEFDQLFDSVGKHYNVDPALLKTVFHVESNGNVNVGRGTSGEIGPMQFMPDTAKRYGVANPADMGHAVPGAARLLREALDANGNDPVKALQVYNGGDRGPRNFQTTKYVDRAIALYPQMQAKQVAAKGSKPAPANSDDDLINEGKQLLQGTLPAKTPATKTPAAPAATSDDDLINEGKKLLSQPTPEPLPASPPAPTPAPNPQTGTPRMFPELRNMLETDPNSQYGSVIPLKRNAEGRLGLTMPTALRDMAGGVLDLLEGPTTGTVTPQGTMALGNMMVGGPKTFGSVASEAGNAARAGAAEKLMTRQAATEAKTPGILSEEFKAAPKSSEFAPGSPKGETSPSGVKGPKPNADPNSAATSKFADMLMSKMADKVAKGGGLAVGHMIGGPVGMAAGYFLTPLIKDVVAQYGPRVGSAVETAVRKRMMLDNLLNKGGAAGRNSLPAYQQPSQEQMDSWVAKGGI